ncbi:MAG: fasciclin domain-containing protein [Deltaproteobacteria bacterium]|nr:fasciclin domain-containing protein [Deltaproteobacteria bacterium]
MAQRRTAHLDGKTTAHLKDGKFTSVNDAKIIAQIPAENGMLYIIDTVLLPPEK